MSCDRSCFDDAHSDCQLGCDGGYLDLAFKFISERGVVPEGCVPYAGEVTPCPAECSDGTPIASARYAAPGVVRHPYGEQAMMEEILTSGPVATGFDVFGDFYYYRRGIYQHVWGTQDGGHAIKIIGWGEELGVKYWIAQNSWGPTWGEHGYFRMVRGINSCGLEEEAYTLVLGSDAVERRPSFLSRLAGLL